MFIYYIHVHVQMSMANRRKAKGLLRSPFDEEIKSLEI
jgi:hypothetical protein